jgi:hypothetical protein
LIGISGIGFAGVNIYLLRKQGEDIRDQRVAMQDSVEVMSRQSQIMERQVKIADVNPDLSIPSEDRYSRDQS